MEKEEEAAKYRLQRAEQEKGKAFGGMSGQGNRNNAEPYIQQGYDAMPGVNSGLIGNKGAVYNQSTDPAYKSREWWKLSDETEPMEHQYGMLQHLQMYGYLDYSSTIRTDGDAEMS